MKSTPLDALQPPFRWLLNALFISCGSGDEANEGVGAGKCRFPSAFPMWKFWHFCARKQSSAATGAGKRDSLRRDKLCPGWLSQGEGAVRSGLVMDSGRALSAPCMSHAKSKAFMGLMQLIPVFYFFHAPVMDGHLLAQKSKGSLLKLNQMKVDKTQGIYL